MSSPAPEKKKKKWEIRSEDLERLVKLLPPDIAKFLDGEASTVFDLSASEEKNEEKEEPHPKKVGSRKGKWELTQEAFAKFLTALTADPAMAGEEYERLRERLIFFFERRKCRHSNELTDETINRVCKKLDEGEQIEKITNYCYTVAGYVWKEYLKGKDLKTESLDERAFE